MINLFGLSLAVACCLILGLYLRSELTYDQHNVNYKRIYRIVNEFTLSGPPDPLAETPIPLGPMLNKLIPAIQDYVRFILPGQNMLIRSGGKAYFWDGVYMTDPSVFKIFTHDILYGDPDTALRDQNSVAVSESFARKYFGDENPLGKTVTIVMAPEIPRRISLVFRDLPENSHLKYSVLFKYKDPPDPRPYLFRVQSYTYLLMPEHYAYKKFPAQCDAFFDRHMAEGARRQNIKWRCWLQPLAKVHLGSDLIFDLPTGNRYYIYGFTAVAVFILLVACINYVNLAIARASRRAKEIGMRKILGASRLRLAMRFLGESLIFAFAALIVGVVLVKLALVYSPVSSLLGKPLALNLMHDPALAVWLIILGLVIGVLSGAYPAIYLSSTSPLSALVSSIGGRSGGFRLREMLVLVQFMVSVIVIASTLVMAMQLRYVAQLPMGFAQKNRVIINMQGLDIIQDFNQIKDRLLTDSRILGVTYTSSMISSGQNVPLGPGMVANHDGVMEITSYGSMAVEKDFLKVMGIDLTAGRDFSQRLLTDVGNVYIANETMVKRRDWDKPVGMRINNGRVIGVVKDFHIQSVHDKIAPVVMVRDQIDFKNVPRESRPAFRRLMVVHLSGKDTSRTLEFIRTTMRQFDPDHPFEYRFLDDSINSMYLSEKHLMQMTGVFSVICIFISCLGLFGLTAFSTEQRSKEIGIRKVLGATAAQIIMVLARKILWLVIAASIAACVVAYYAMDEWLAGFAYRTEIQLWVFLVSTAVVTFVAYVTIALQSYKAALANPAHTIRYE